MKLRFSHWLKKEKRKHISRGGSITFTKTTEDSYVIRKNKGCAVPQSLHLSCVHNCSSSHYVNENISWLNETQQTVTVHSTKNTTELPELTAPLMDIYDYKTCSFDKSLTWSLICYQNPFIRQVQLTYRCWSCEHVNHWHTLYIRIQKHGTETKRTSHVVYKQGEQTTRHSTDTHTLACSRLQLEADRANGAKCQNLMNTWFISSDLCVALT